MATAFTKLYKGCRIVFGFFFASGFRSFFGFLSRYHFPCICNSLELEPVILHGICYILTWSLCIFAWYLLHLAMFAFHFAWYLSYFCISTSHLRGICHILVLQTFMWVSWGFFRLSFRVSFKVSFRVSLRVLFRASFGVSFKVSFRVLLRVLFGASFAVSFRVSLGFHLGFLYGFI